MTTVAAPSLLSVLRQFYALTKPRVIQLIVFCALIGMVLAVPAESLLFMDGAAQVVTVVDGKAQRVTVVPGLSDGTWTEVTGVPEGATVIVRGGASVADGVVITPKVVTL